jgi:hypothetical protein
MKNGKMIHVWGDPVVVLSNYDPADGHTEYSSGCVAVTWHYDGDFENAGSLSANQCLFLDREQIPDLIDALKEMMEG